MRTPSILIGILLGSFVLLSTSLASATTTAASSCSFTHVQAAVDASSDGDTVTVPACTSTTWTTRVTINNKSISLIGAGIGQTIIAGADTTNGSLGAAVSIISKATGSSPSGFTRLSGFTFTGPASAISGGYANGAIISLRGVSKNLRVDHNRIVITGTSGITSAGAVAGVVDHNELINNGSNVHQTTLQHDNWDGTETSTVYGDTSWSSASTVGTADTLIFEDNVFQNIIGADGWYCSDDFKGARTVYRFNSLIDCSIQRHGTESGGRPRSARHWEIYRNTFSWALTLFGGVIANRGATGIYFDNTVTDNGNLQYIARLTTFRRHDLISAHTVGGTPYGRCGTFTATNATRTFSGGIVTVTLTFPEGAVYSYAASNDVYVSYETIAGASPSDYNGTFATAGILGSTTQLKYQFASVSDPGAISGTVTMKSPFDGNTDSTGYRCLDQAGAGQSILYTGNQPNFLPDISPVSNATNALEPILFFNNTLNGTVNALQNDGIDIAIENRDFYNQNASFTGATGIGVGLLAARPATCTTGVGYWATDQGSWNLNGTDGLYYKCTSTDTWALFYTPYTYPHPLQGAASPTPTLTNVGTSVSPTLIWSPSTETNFAGYHVYRSATSGGTRTLVCTRTVASAAALHTPLTRCLTRLPIAGTYYFTVTTFNDAGEDATLSSEVTVVSAGQTARSARQ